MVYSKRSFCFIPIFDVQINFEREVVLTKVLLQGDGEDSWVTKFKVQSSKDGKDWQFVSSNGLSSYEAALIFGGNTNEASTTSVKCLDSAFERKHYEKNMIKNKCLCNCLLKTKETKTVIATYRLTFRFR